MQFTSNRVCGVIVKINDMNMLLANVYMPTDTDHDRQNHLEYTSILQEIMDMRDNLDIQHIIVGGDFNTDPRRLRSLHSIALNDILFKNNLLSWLLWYFGRYISMILFSICDVTTTL